MIRQKLRDLWLQVFPAAAPVDARLGWKVPDPDASCDCGADDKPWQEHRWPAGGQPPCPAWQRKNQLRK